TEDDALRGARLLTGGADLPVVDLAALDPGVDLCSADALHAVGALFHHPALPYRDRGVVDHFQRLRLLGVVVSEEIETPDLVGAVVRAEPRADAAVVDHFVEPIRAVHGR